ncbi:MAG: ABC transporter ATP-binding protein [Ilumatobacteraceae bacterium]
MAGSGTAHLAPRSPDVMLRVEGLTVEFRTASGATISAVSDVSLDIARGETLGLVGESGCGKSTIAKAVMQLLRPTAGTVEFEGVDLCALSKHEVRSARQRIQMIMQDPISSLNPRRSVRQVVREGIEIWGLDDGDDERVDELLESVGLDPQAIAHRGARELSGGQCQRLCIARALALEPVLMVCDEPVSALDVSIQAQLLNLLRERRDRLGLTMMFIAHDLAVVKNISDRVMVMYLGKVCEVAPADLLFESPAHPYTVLLERAIPDPDPARSLPPPVAIGDLPSPADPPSGCRFRTRCDRATDVCVTDEPVLRPLGPGHFVACHHPHPVDPTGGTP